MTAPVETRPADVTDARPVVSDDGSTIRLDLYRGAEAVAGFALPPFLAIGLAADLLQAARRRLGQWGDR